MYYDFTTTNDSFLKIYNILKEFGIKNNKFFLKLNNGDLQGINPHSKNLTEDQKRDIIQECKDNYWYFLREVVRIPFSDKGNTPYVLKRNNLAYNYCMLSNYNVIYETIRQQGKLIDSLLYLLHGDLFFGNKSFMTAKDTITNKNSYFRMGEIYNVLPDYIKDFNLINNIDLKLDNDYYYNTIFLDDFPVIKNNVKTMKESKYVNQILAITGGIKVNKLEEGNSIYDAYVLKEESIPFSELWYDIDNDTIKNIYGLHFNLKSNAERKFVHIVYGIKELGYDEEKFKEICAILNNNWNVIKSEILLKWI